MNINMKDIGKKDLQWENEDEKELKKIIGDYNTEIRIIILLNTTTLLYY
jgi:hypothetical protein